MPILMETPNETHLQQEDLYFALERTGADDNSLRRVADLLDEHEGLSSYAASVRDAFADYQRGLISMEELAYEIG